MRAAAIEALAKLHSRMACDPSTDLSRIPGMLVISRNSAFTHKDKQVDTKQIGRELSVRYVLEGSVQRSGKQVQSPAAY